MHVPNCKILTTPVVKYSGDPEQRMHAIFALRTDVNLSFQDSIPLFTVPHTCTLSTLSQQDILTRDCNDIETTPT